jgi:predicted HAD superfamily phosphohydrolase YqeG
MAVLKIVWKNPKAEPRKRRWHELASDVGRRVYLVEELVPQGSLKQWAQRVALEIIVGGRAA